VYVCTYVLAYACKYTYMHTTPRRGRIDIRDYSAGFRL